MYTIPPYTKEGFYNVGGVARPPIIFDPSSIPELDDPKLQTIIAQHRAKMSDVSKAKLTTEDKELLEEVAVVETKAPEHASGHDSDDETGNQEVEAMRAKLQRLQTSISMYPYVRSEASSVASRAELQDILTQRRSRCTSTAWNDGRRESLCWTAARTIAGDL